MNTNEVPQEIFDQLMDLLDDKFNEDELRDLCAHVDVDYDDLPPGGADAKARELALKMKRSDGLPYLIARGKHIRPELSWPEIPTAPTPDSPNQARTSHAEMRESTKSPNRLMIVAGVVALIVLVVVVLVVVKPGQNSDQKPPNAGAPPAASTGAAAQKETEQPNVPVAQVASTRAPATIPPGITSAPAAQSPAPVITPTPTPAGVVVQVASDGANLRSGPGTAYPIVGQARTGDLLPLLGRNGAGDWLQVGPRDRPVWISAGLVTWSPDVATAAVVADIMPPPTSTAPPATVTPPPTPPPATNTPSPTPPLPTVTSTPSGPVVVVSGDTVNLRGGPGTAYPIVGQARTGDLLPLLGRNAAGDWLQVGPRDRTIWIFAGLVTWSPDVATVAVVADIAPPSASTLTATPAPASTASPAATATAAKPACAVPLIHGFGQVWNAHPDVQSLLGCPAMTEQSTGASIQRFERGWMLWLTADNQPGGNPVYVLGGSANGQYQRFADAGPSDPALSAARDRLGGETGTRIDTAAAYQQFISGLMMWVEKGIAGRKTIFVLREGAWSSYEDTYGQ